MKKRGAFIVIDGGEGVGKSTQLGRLRKHFGDELVFTREPGGSPYAEEIRKIALHSENAGAANAKTMFALFWAGRADHLNHTIVPALESGRSVISDRFDSATFGLQIYGQRARELEGLFWTMREHYLADCAPDTYVFLDVEPRVALQRNLAERTENNHFDERDLEFHRRVRLGLQTFASLVPVPTHNIDASQPIDKVSEDLVGVVSKYV